jgi:chemotaxis protein methyltransferase CheR
MSLPPPIETLVELVRGRIGNVVPAARHGFLEQVAERRAQATGYPEVAQYVRALASGHMDREWDRLIPLITIKESYFFRAPQQFEVIRQQVLPRLRRARSGARHLRVWSAACARGEEAGTLAMLLAEEKALEGWDWTILATDVDEEALAGARLGLYGERAVAQVPPALRERWFQRRGKFFELAPALRSRIVYQPLNLARTPYLLPFAELDLILLRNVLIYFRRPLQKEVVMQAARSLSAEGYLFLGASETLWQIQEDLDPVDLGACFAYRHRGAEMESRSKGRTERKTGNPGVLPPGPEPRVAEPAAADPEAGKPARVAVEPPVQPAALAQPGGLHERLLAAARDLAANRIAEASRGLEQVLAAEPSEPAAHALDGFLHDVSGRADEAATAYRAALYLDPALYQVRVLLADCLLRLGHRDRAEQQYREVLTSLGSGRERDLLLFEDLPFPDRERAQRRSRQVLQGEGR